jgi:hypothetical protein
MTHVWVVAESRFEWYEIRHICGDMKTATRRWNEVCLELIKENQEMVEYCIENNYSPNPWSANITLLHNLNPGDECNCDYPDLKEWVVEE